VPAWTGPDAQQLYPGWRCEGRFDVSGGWYDAGDYGKYVTSGAIAVWQLLSTLELLTGANRVLSDGFANMIRTECRWQLDWLLRMQVPAGDALAGLAFHRVHGTVWSPMPGWAHEDRPNECCIGRRRRRACSWPRLPLKVLDCSVPVIPRMPEPCWRRRAARTRRPSGILA
jgi:hypothetical protein